jgi:hypothetical protein
MTVKQLTQIERYVGPSTATKPLDCSVGSTFLEEDTSRLFVFDGTGWFPKTQDIVIYDAEGNPLGIEGGRMKVSVDASVVAPEEVVWSNITLRDGSDPDNKLAILPDGSLKAQLSGKYGEAWIPVKVDSEGRPIVNDIASLKADIALMKTAMTDGNQKVQLSGAKVIRKVITIATIGAGQVQTNIITPDKPSRLVGVFSNIRTEGSPTTGDLRMDVHVGAGDLDFMSRIVRLVSVELVSTRKILTIQPSGIEANTQIALPRIEDIGGYLSHCSKFSFSPNAPLVVEISNTTDRPVSNPQLRRLEVWYTSI